MGNLREEKTNMCWFVFCKRNLLFLLPFFAISFLRANYIPDQKAYDAFWKKSVENREEFWATQAQMIPWMEPYKAVWKAPQDDIFVGKWFEGGKLNVADVCLERWAKKCGNQTALIWVSEEDTGVVPKTRVFSYEDLSSSVNQMANVLKKCGVVKGDRVGIWMPMLPELLITQFACAKIGAVSVVIFSGFSASNTEARFSDAGCKVIVTADGGRRRGKIFPLRPTLSQEYLENGALAKIITYNNVNLPYTSTNKDLSWNEIVPTAPTTCDSVPMDAEDPLFLLYTSGTTGKPKGIVHTTAGYLMYAMSTMKYAWGIHGLLFPDKESSREVWLCTADIGWITGHSYVTYAPFALGVTVLMYEGVFTYPQPTRFFSLIDRYHVTHCYTSPTFLRQLASYGDAFASRYKLDSLRALGSVGEPIDPTTWRWYYEKIGKSRCPIIDTYWQTETGGYLISPIAGVTELQPGSCCFPFLSIAPKILREDGSEANIGEKGFLCVAHSWPGMMRTIYKDHNRFIDTYLKKFPGYYFTGDEAYKDNKGYIWIMGRADDVIKIAGHRLGTAELEACINSYADIVESAAIAVPDAIKGNGLAIFVVSKKNITETDLKNHIRKAYGPVAVPDHVFFVQDLPKTRSGKILRRLLKNIYLHESIQETSTLVNPEAIAQISAQLEKYTNHE